MFDCEVNIKLVVKGSLVEVDIEGGQYGVSDKVILDNSKVLKGTSSVGRLGGYTI